MRTDTARFSKDTLKQKSNLSTHANMLPTHSQSECQEEDTLTDALLRAAATAAEAEDRATNYDTVRAVLFRSKLRDPWGFGLGLSSTNAVLVTDLVIGGLADGQLQVRLTPLVPLACVRVLLTCCLLRVSVTRCLVRHHIKSFFLHRLRNDPIAPYVHRSSLIERRPYCDLCSPFAAFPCGVL